jgi:hypothetical protein
MARMARMANMAQLVTPVTQVAQVLKVLMAKMALLVLMVDRVKLALKGMMDKTVLWEQLVQLVPRGTQATQAKKEQLVPSVTLVLKALQDSGAFKVRRVLLELQANKV